MGTSFIPKTMRAVLKNSRRNVVNNTFGGVTGIPIDRDGGLIDEIVLRVSISAAFQVAASAVDVRQFIERVNLRSNRGDLVKSLSGQQLYDMARLTEKQATPVFVPGAGGGATGSVDFSVEIHAEFDGAYFDAAGSLKSADLSKLDLEIVWASQAKMQGIGFIGSTFAAAPALVCTVDVENYVRPDMALRGDCGTHDHLLTSRESSNTVTGMQTIELDPSCITRFIGLHVDNVAGGVNAAVPSDAILGSVKITQGSRILCDSDFTSLRFGTEQKRDLNITGFAVVDFGDQNAAWAELDASPIFLQFEVLAGSPAWRVQVTQDYAKMKTGV
jgi:hypothetical protein